VTRELTLLKREMRRVRRKLLDGTGLQEPEPPPEPAREPRRQPSAQPATATITADAEDLQQGASKFETVLKPWLRGFLPSSA
jgi:hypothetical protein